MENNFVKVVPSKDKKWITDVYYGIKEADKHGHLLLSGSQITNGDFVVGDGYFDLRGGEVLYHRDDQGKVLLDTGIKR